MATSEEIANEILAWSDAQIAAPPRELVAERRFALADTDFFGLALTVPARVALDADELPVVLAWRATGMRAWEVGRDVNVVLAAVDLDTGEAFFGQYFAPPRDGGDPRPAQGTRPPPPDDVSARSVGAGIWRRDARRVLDLPWRPARLRVFAICYDWISNLADVEVAGSPRASIARSARPARAPRTPDRAPEPLPTYLPWASMGWPEAQTLTFGIGNDAAAGNKLVAWGAFSVSATAAHAALPATIEEVDGAEHPVGAIVPVTIALAGLDCCVPWRLDLAVPVYGAALEGDPLHGAFIVDVDTGIGATLPAGSYQAYALLEGRVFGPLPFVR